MKQWICAIALLSLLGLSACDSGNHRDQDEERSILNQDREDHDARDHDREDDDGDRRRDRDDDDD